MKSNLLKNKIKASVLFFVVLIAISLFLSTIDVKAQDSNVQTLDNQCDGDHTDWIPLSVTGGTLASGNYYLNENITLVNNIIVSSGTVNICLNGNILTGALGSNQSIFTVTGGTVNIYDCNKDNKIHNYKIKEVKANSSQDIDYNNSKYTNKLFQRYYDFSDVGDGIIIGGIITGGHKYSASPDLSYNFLYEGGGSAFLIGRNGGTVNFYGGTISGNTTTHLSMWSSGHYERSGAVGVRAGGTFNFYNGKIVGNSSRFYGAGIYCFGSSAATPARANLYGGIISDNYVLDAVYKNAYNSTYGSGGAGINTDNVSGASSIVSISGAPQITNNKSYEFESNSFIGANMSYSTESTNSIRVLGKLYTESNGKKTYASIGLFGGAWDKLTSNYTVSGNTHEDVNKIFFADNKTQAVAYNSVNGELKYVTVNLYVLTYNANNQTGATSTVSVVDKISVDDSPFNNTGYVFFHWNTNPDDSGTSYMPNDIITLSNNQTLYAIWKNASYSINYWKNGGSFDSTVKSTYTFGETFALPTPIWSGKTFDGWYNNAMLTGDAITEITPNDFGEKTYYAKWSGVIHYIITSTAGENGTISPFGSIIYDGTSQDYWILPNKGYKIAAFIVNGIDKKADIVNNVYTITGVKSDTNISVTFEKILSTDITVYSTCGEHGNISPNGYSVVANGSNITYVITPNPGYKVSNVILNGTSLGAVSTYTLNNVTSSQSIHAEFTIMTASVTLNVNGGVFIEGYTSPIEYVEGVGVTLPNDSEISKANYTFDGWFDNENFEGAPIVKVLPTDTGAKAYWAKWTKNQINVIGANNVNVIYDGKAHYITVEGMALGDVVTYKTVGEYSSINPTFTNVTNAVTVYYKVTRNDNFEYEGFAKVTISPANISGVSVTGYNGIYDGMTHEAVVTKVATTINNQSLTWQYKTSKAAEYSSGMPTLKDASATAYIIYYKVSAPNHNDITGSFSSNITAKNISGATITLGTTLTYTGKEQTQNVASVMIDGLEVTFDVNGNKATNYSTNGYTLTVTGNGNFTGDASKTWNITKANYDMSGVTFNNDTVTYDGNSHSIIIGGTLPIGADNIAVTVTYSGSATNVSEGVIMIVATFATKSSNYNVPDAKTATISIIAATITNNGAFSNYNGAYDSATHSIGYDASKLVVANNQTITIKYSIDNLTWIDGLTYKDFTNGAITVYWKASAPNHSDLTGSNTIAITKKAITVTTEDKSSVHKHDLVELTYDVSPALYSGDSFTGTLATNADKSIVGEYEITQGTLSAGDNYSITFVGAKYNVTPKATVSIVLTIQNKTYNGISQEFVVTGTNLTGFAIEYFVSGSYTKTAPTNAGNYKVKITRVEDTDYYAFSVEITDGLIIAKATFDMNGITFINKTVKANGTAQSIIIDGTLPLGVTVTYENNGKTESGIYTITAKFLGDAINYNKIPDKTATLKLLISQFLEKTDDNNTETPDIEVSAESGFEPDLDLIISVVKSDSISLNLSNNDKVVKVYSVNIVRAGKTIQLTESVTVKLLIPSQIKDKEFHIYDNEKELSYTIQNGYAVITVDSLTDFAFVINKVQEFGSIMWFIILFAIILAVEIGLAVYKIIKDKNEKLKVKTYSFTPLLFVNIILDGQVAIAITLGVLCVVFGLFDLYFFLPKKRIAIDKEIKKEKNEGDFDIANENITFTAIDNEVIETDAIPEIADEYEEDTEVLKEVEADTGLAILVRYRKSFSAKLIQSLDETKNNYSELKNVLLSYKKVKSQISWNYDSINSGRVKLAKFNIRGNTLYLYLALNPDHFEDTKYKVERTKSKKYEDTPCLYKIKSNRRVNYALDLISILAEENGLVKGEEKSVSYYSPYETTEALIEKGLIKELVSKEKYDIWYRRQNKQEVEGKKRTFISAGEVDSILKDEVAKALVIEQKSSDFNQKKEKCIVNIDTIAARFSEGETVNLHSLKQKGMIGNKVNYFKVLARGKLDKSLTMEANDFSIEAIKMILLTGGKVIRITQ